MFDDIVVEKIDTLQLHHENETLGQGGFEKMKYLKVTYPVNLQGVFVLMNSFT